MIIDLTKEESGILNNAILDSIEKHKQEAVNYINSEAYECVKIEIEQINLLGKLRERIDTRNKLENQTSEAGTK